MINFEMKSLLNNNNHIIISPFLLCIFGIETHIQHFYSFNAKISWNYISL